MPSVKGEKYMEMHEAKIERSGDAANLVLSVGKNSYTICLTDDNPVQIKEVFNGLVKELKKEKFNFTLTDNVSDLFFHICTEYIKQLNSELSSVYGQMREHCLVDSKNA